ncbi:helix-turn-helix transcriptional regulator [bacterium]|nr:helix-turn-helix transcriptional regulator [bacterium]
MYKTIRLKIGRKIQYKRKKLGLSINKLSASCGVSASTISRIENTTCNLRLNQLEKL